jgi:hypothetical protein
MVTYRQTKSIGCQFAQKVLHGDEEPLKYVEPLHLPSCHI